MHRNANFLLVPPSPSLPLQVRTTAKKATRNDCHRQKHLQRIRTGGIKSQKKQRLFFFNEVQKMKLHGQLMILLRTRNPTYIFQRHINVNLHYCLSRECPTYNVNANIKTCLVIVVVWYICWNEIYIQCRIILYLVLI